MPLDSRAACVAATIAAVLCSMCGLILLSALRKSGADGTCYVDGCGAAAPPPADVSVCGWGSGLNPDPVGGKPAGCTYCAGGQCRDKIPLGLDCGDDNDCQSNYCAGSTWGVNPMICTGTVNTRCHIEGCDTPAAPPEDSSVCQWHEAGGGKFRPQGCAYCADGQCVNKLPIGANCTDHNDCQSDACSNDFKCAAKPTGGCEALGCGSAWPTPADPSVCNWLSQPDGNHKVAGCAFCYGGQCINKKPLGTLGCGDDNDCQTSYCMENVCVREDPALVCTNQGCGEPAPPPAEPSVCKWGTGAPAAFKPAGCAFCQDGHCVDKHPSGQRCGDDNDCQSNRCVEVSQCVGQPGKTCADSSDCGPEGGCASWDICA